MFAPVLLTTLFAALATVRADPDPSEPGPGAVYNEGSTCHIAWDPDTSGTWKNMTISLMSGSNTAMNFIESESGACLTSSPDLPLWSEDDLRWC